MALLHSEPLNLTSLKRTTVSNHMKTETDAYKAGKGFRSRPNSTAWFDEVLKTSTPTKCLTEAEILHGGYLADATEGERKKPALSTLGRPLKLQPDFMDKVIKRSMAFKDDIQFGPYTVQLMASKTYAEAYAGGVTRTGSDWRGVVCVHIIRMHSRLLRRIADSWESLTGKRKRGGGKVAKARAQKPAPAPAGGGVSAAQLDDSEDVTDAENSSDSDNEAAGGGARVAPVRGQPREINSEILPEESGLNMLWQDYGDAVTGGKKTVTAKKKIFFDTLDSIIVQYEEIDGGESRAAAFMAVKVELDGVVVPAAVNVDHVIRKHCGDVQ